MTDDGDGPRQLEHDLSSDLSAHKWASFAASVGANVVANIATAGVVYAYVRVTGVVKSNDATAALDWLAIVLAAILVVGTVAAWVRHRR